MGGTAGACASKQSVVTCQPGAVCSQVWSRDRDAADSQGLLARWRI